ncbi:hypothetical protein PPERSA_00776 [Pseudocohnilembus persalinus]|uniref:Alpha-1,3/1,6-mannosyltransferase ALG2 n=1 Tax=Pseudocohnilembus persalinus TaxID=266149 RepID=A0A0V0Q9T0_PSEPJ|nr:hypothetical protein PPERSA_00776 [Pseudocohnilembus persalinus]|eukprot:KRW98949.1 hypothetical protein PPERSA_00776 [Pseudocohnilembus persalinus]
MQQNQHKVAFIHPDLGIGGAEQLVINLGLALKQKNVEVCYFTPYHDPEHCFPDTVNGNLKVKVCGNWIPANFFGKFTALCAMIRVFLATLYVLIFEKEYDTNIGLAISSFAKFIELNGNDENQEYYVLIIAGGYEERQKENYEYYQELLEMSQKHNLQERVIFLKNVSSELKSLLLSRAVAILYTPENEHFGIVPVESMYNETPVIAMNSGGPKESILNENTGFLINGTQSEKWAEKMQILAQNPERKKKMGKEGKNRVIQLFGFEQFMESIYNSYVTVNQKQNKILKGQQKKQE